MPISEEDRSTVRAFIASLFEAVDQRLMEREVAQTEIELAMLRMLTGDHKGALEAMESAIQGSFH